MNFYTKNLTKNFFVGVGGGEGDARVSDFFCGGRTRVSDYFTKNPNLIKKKRFFFFLGGGGGSGMARLSDFFYKESKSKKKSGTERGV